MISNLHDVYFYTIIILGTGITLKSLELCAIADTFQSKKINDWDLVGLDDLQISKWASIFKAIFSKQGIVISCIASILSVFSSAFFFNSFLFTGSIIVLFICQLIIHHRQEFGGDGADQMSFLILITFTLCFAVNKNEQIQKIGIFFISGQLILSYIVSGWSKIISVEWRNGTAIQGILSSYTYGSEFTRDFFTKHLFYAKIVGWVIIVFESLFPISLICNSSIFYTFLVTGLLLHLAIGIIMGLNDFVWSFGAAYPSLIYLYFGILQPQF